MLEKSLINMPIKLQEDAECGADVYQEVGTRPADSYFTFFVHVLVIGPTAEAPDEEIIGLAEKSGAFSFLANKEEDIYTLGDGTPIR